VSALFDCVVFSEMIINLRMIEAMHLTLFNNMSLPYSHPGPRQGGRGGGAMPRGGTFGEKKE